jgi:hypothetical protein
MRRAVLVLAVLAGLAAPAAAQVFDGRAGQLQVTVPRLETQVTVDGRLDEPAWQQAASLVGFSQYSPADEQPAMYRTEVRVFYAPTFIAFGIRAEAPPGSVRATLAERDRISADDNVQIFLGTYNDGRQALMFAVNPLGVQADGTLVEGTTQSGHGLGTVQTGRPATDLSADFVFDSRGRLTPEGYDVEVRIPFKTLRYQPAPMQAWDLHIVRVVRSTGHEDSWVPARRAAASFLGQAGRLAGLTGLRRGLVVDINPAAIAKTDGAPGEAPDGGWQYSSATAEVGGNVRWGITPNLTLNGTINPDFSQVESDAGQFVYDPREAVYFPEKRPFFLDGIEQFSTLNNLIYTRRIVAPVTAAKVTGKVSGTGLAYLFAVDDPATSASGDDYPVFNVLRVQRDIGEGSRAAFVYTDRNDGPSANRVAAADTWLTFRGIYSMQLQGAVSVTTSPGDTITAPLWQASFDRTGRRYVLRSTLRGVSDEFRADAGFVRRAGVVNADVTNGVNLYGARGAAIERWSGDVSLQGTWQYDDFVHGRGAQDRKLHFNSDFTFRGGWQLGQSVFVETFGFDEALYADYRLLSEGPAGPEILPFVGTPRLPNLDFVVSGSTPRVKGVELDAFVLWGKDENFFEWASADILFVEADVAWRPTERLRVDATYQEQAYRRRTDGSTVGRRRIPRLKVEYQVARPLFVRVVSQYDSELQDDLRDDSRTELPIVYWDEPTGTYERALGFSRNSLRTDVLFSYQPTPGTVVFFGYGNTLADPDAHTPPGRRRASDGFFVKVSYLWRL